MEATGTLNIISINFYVDMNTGSIAALVDWYKMPLIVDQRAFLGRSPQTNTEEKRKGTRREEAKLACDDLKAGLGLWWAGSDTAAVLILDSNYDAQSRYLDNPLFYSHLSAAQYP